MFPIAVAHALEGAWPLVLVNLAVSAAVAIGILARAGELTIR